MNTKQILHIAMMNSFNILTNLATIEEVIDSELNITAHVPTEELTPNVYDMLIDYFQDVEMYEKCVTLTQLKESLFNEDGTIKVVSCECDYPEFNSYTGEIKCYKCKKTIKK